MRNKGFSLIEVTVVIAISTVIGLAITFNFLTAHYLRSMTQDNIALSREARIAMNHMTRVLRFAITNDDERPITAISNQITATIEGGPEGDPKHHLDFITSDTYIEYNRIPADQTLEYTQGTEDAVIIAGGGERDIDITHFFPSLEMDGSEIKIELRAKKGNRREFELITRIRPLGE